MRVVAGLLALALPLAACGKADAPNASAQAPRQAPVPVTVAEVVQKAVPLQVRAIGTVEAYSTVSVKAQAGGELTGVHFKEGQDVEAGQLLFTIDPRPLEAALQQAQAMLAKDQALAAQARANIARDVSKVKQAEATVARDLAQAKNAQVQAQRYADLLKQQLVAQQDYDQFRTAAEALQATVQADQADLASAQEAVRADEAAVKSAEGTIRADQAAVENARLQLGYTTIRSPIGGRTGSLLLQQGNIVRSGGNSDSTLVTINRIQPIYVSFSVPERELGDIKRYMAAGRVEVDALIPGEETRPARGVVTFVDNSVDRTTGTIKLKGTFANEARRLWPGQFVNVVLTLATEPDAIVVPSQAVQTGQEGQFVFVVKPDMTVDVRPVVPERIQDGATVIRKGLRPGETVVTDGQVRLVPGTKVDAKRGAAATGGSSS